MINFNLPDTKDPRNFKELFGITTDRIHEIMEGMKASLLKVQKEYLPVDRIEKNDAMQRFVREIPLNDEGEVFFLGYICGRMFAEIPSDKDPLREIIEGVLR